MDTLINEILENRIIAIGRGASSQECLKVVEALYQGGIRFIEITYNQSKPDSWEETAHTIGVLADQYKGRVHIGAGTVTNPHLVELTHENHGEYIISPNTDVDVIRRTKELGMLSIPGAMTPSEIMTAHHAGADFVKLFPAGDLGTSYVKAIKAPLNHIRLLAVGGVNEENIGDFLKAGCVGAGIGGNLAKKDWIKAGEYGKLTEAAVRLLEAVKEAGE